MHLSASFDIAIAMTAKVHSSCHPHMSAKPPHIPGRLQSLVSEQTHTTIIFSKQCDHNVCVSQQQLPSLYTRKLAQGQLFTAAWTTSTLVVEAIRLHCEARRAMLSSFIGGCRSTTLQIAPPCQLGTACLVHPPENTKECNRAERTPAQHAHLSSQTNEAVPNAPERDGACMYAYVFLPGHGWV